MLKLLILVDLDHEPTLPTPTCPSCPPTCHVHAHLPIKPNTPGWLEGSLGGWVGNGVGGFRVHGVGGGVGGAGVHGGVDGWRVHGVGAYTHPPMNSYNVKTFHFMNTHPPTHQTYPKCHPITVHILTHT